MNEQHSTTHRTTNPGRGLDYHDLLRLEERMTTESRVSQRSGLLRTRTDMMSADGPRLIARAVAHTWPCAPFTLADTPDEEANRMRTLDEWVKGCDAEPSLVSRIPVFLWAAVETGSAPQDVPPDGISRIVLFEHLWVESSRDMLRAAVRTVAQCLYVAGATDRGALVVTPSSRSPYGCEDTELAEEMYQELRIPALTETLRAVSGATFEFCRAVERFGFER